MSHSLLWRHTVLLMVGVYSSNHRVLYTIGISITRRFQKSVGPSVCPFVTLTKKSTASDGRAPGEKKLRSRSLLENGAALPLLHYKRSALPLPLQQKKERAPLRKLLNVGHTVIIYVIINCTPFCYTLHIT